VDELEIAGKTVVVTGAASGIGLAIAEAGADQGARLALADIEPVALESARDLIARRGGEVIAVSTDVRHATALEQLRDEVDRVFGGADIVCNNAGVLSPLLPLWEMPVADVEWVFAVNLWGIVRGVQAFVPGMIARGHPGHVVNTSSMAALGAAPYTAAYGMSKAAVVSLSCSLRDELQAVGAPVGVSVLLPEMIRTRLAFAERNRAADSQPVDEDPALNFANDGLDPAVIGDRVVRAIRRESFWILPPSDDPFMQAASLWMDGIKGAAV
jgi:NAD(P)-dependent dehydrogenase (short-subunit alcohol dehydrogenase family)